MKKFNCIAYIIIGLLFFGCSTIKEANKEKAMNSVSSSKTEQSDPLLISESTDSNNAGSAYRQLDEEYEIRPGDQIEILVWQYENFNTKTTVNFNGTITVPLIGEVIAGGLTKAELKQQLVNELSKYIKSDINLTVAITESNNQLISVLGSVGKPDNYPVNDRRSLFEILSRAGGVSEDADLRNIRIYHSTTDSDYDKVDLTNYFERGSNRNIVTVGPGDVVYVPKEENVIREFSDFLRDFIVLFGVFRVFY